MSQDVEFPWEDMEQPRAEENSHAASQPASESNAPEEPSEPKAAPHAESATPPSRPRTIARKEYYSIGEVAELVGLPAHVLRYWESQFSVLNPSKNRSGNRAYQRKEIRLILLVKQLLYEDKYTVEGAKTKLDQLRKGGDLANASAGALDKELMALLRQDVTALRQVLAGSGA